MLGCLDSDRGSVTSGVVAEQHCERLSEVPDTYAVFLGFEISRRGKSISDPVDEDVGMQGCDESVDVTMCHRLNR